MKLGIYLKQWIKKKNKKNFNQTFPSSTEGTSSLTVSGGK